MAGTDVEAEKDVEEFVNEPRGNKFIFKRSASLRVTTLKPLIDTYSMRAEAAKRFTYSKGRFIMSQEGVTEAETVRAGRNDAIIE